MTPNKFFHGRSAGAFRNIRFMKFVKMGSGLWSSGWMILLAACSTFGGIQPVELRCESKLNPLGLSETSPRLSWQEVATVPGERGQYQTAYADSGCQFVASIDQQPGRSVGHRPGGDESNVADCLCRLRAHVASGLLLACAGLGQKWSAIGLEFSRLMDHGNTDDRANGRPNGSGATTGRLGIPARPSSTQIGSGFPKAIRRSSAPVATRWFRKVFTVPAGVSVTQAVATMTGDNMFTLYVNGQIALSVEDPNFWQHYGQADISAFWSTAPTFWPLPWLIPGPLRTPPD